MAILASDWLEEEKRRQEDPLSAGAGAYAGRVSAGTQPLKDNPLAPTTEAPAATAQAQRYSTGFINPQDYLAANKAGAQRMADSLAGNVRAAGEAASRGIADLEGRFGAQVAKGTPTVPAAQVAPVTQNPFLTAPAGSLLPRAGFRTTAAGPALASVGVHDSRRAPTENPNVTAARARAEATYTGPASLADLEGFQETSRAARDVGERARGLTTFAGRQAQLGGGAQYGRGMSALDAYLAGAAGGEQFQRLAGEYGDLSGRLSRSLSDTSKADAARANTERVASEAKGYLQDYEARASQARDAAANLARDYDAFLRGGGRGGFQGYLGRPPSREEFAKMPPEVREALANGDFVKANYLMSRARG